MSSAQDAAATAGNPATARTRSTPGQAGQFLRNEHAGGLTRAALHPSDPVAQFQAWFAVAASAEAGIAHPETCTLATAALPSGRVSARMVYFKELETGPGGGFVIYSNFGTSRKGADLFGSSNTDGDGRGGSTGNPYAALVFWWESLERQVRVEGRAERLSPEESQAYFDTRVRGSRIGAWASRQSEILPANPTAGAAADPSAALQGAGDDGRVRLDGWVAETEARFKDEEKIPVPPFWGGLRIVPDRVEFWQGRQNRLHDRFVYERVAADESASQGGSKWTLERLSP